MKKRIFNIDVDDTDPGRLLKTCAERIKNNGRTFIITLNSLMVLDYFFNKEFRKAAGKADIIVPDGAGIVLAGRFFSRPVVHRLTGIDLMHKLLGLAYENRFSVFLLGGTWETADRAYGNLKKWFNQARFLGRYTGYFEKEEEEKVIQGINKLAPDILFVAMGSPRQELWISRNLHRVRARILIGVGGTFDVISGKVKRAPESWRRRNLEWLYRCLTSPKKFLNIFKLAFYLLLMLYFRIFLLNRKRRK